MEQTHQPVQLCELLNLRERALADLTKARARALAAVDNRVQAGRTHFEPFERAMSDQAASEIAGIDQTVAALDEQIARTRSAH